MTKRRLDTLLLERGLAGSDKKAKALVMAGRVSVAERPVSKPGTLVDESAPVDVAASARYASRGGEKLEHALRTFNLDVFGRVAADIGASTGGFTDCLIQHGASRVYATDVGKGQLDYRLRQDPRVVSIERVNAREPVELPEPVDIVTIDVSFISLRQVLPVAAGLLGPTRRRTIVALFKPQFEAHRNEVPRGGVIREPLFHATLIGRFAAWCTRNGFHIVDLTASPITGASGNTEFFFRLRPLS
ncbi:MAG: TlyA family RNA methyltransferase [Vicinamibacterales bacterium]